MRYGRRILVSGGAALLVGYAALIEALLAGVDAPLWLIVPGLAFLGIGQGLCIPPSTALVLAHAKPTQAGAVSGAMSTIQQIGNCVGVAVIGVLFFGAANIQLAFGLSILGLVVIALIALGLTRLLPRAAASGAGR
jgi:sugar phosphate permease